MKRAGSASDPLWYKDAIIYELHVRAFCDGNGDGIGDFPGLIQKLDYLQALGVTCLWLLPFFPSPLKDDGYDIADYVNTHPSYGTMEDFQQFLTAAHQRGLQVMIEMVLNHTSDQHAWFQAARSAPPGSPERDFYVWSDTDQKYKGVRIIFNDLEKSNWTWDPVAQAYYWHRFFSHQPDLNYDNPRVMEEMLKVMRYWLDLGVDGFRIDAITYLVEREGTSCESLPETHAVVKRFRREIDENYSGRMMLAEANQWPADVRPYFADGDECHMAFHFPLMPRIYLALRQEDRLPITDIVAQTPPIPDTCQWGLFLRNHDELTLEMVSTDERDYMHLAYSADPRMRLNLGIRRRLAPLLDNNRRRIELLNSLLLSFPGSPIVYYGDEIGMGDNIYLGDRNGVRTPMQWSPDRNAGFSRATPAKLFSPVIMDPVFGYEAINVEAQSEDPSSLLNWMRNMFALRKLFRVFGRGTMEFLEPANRKVLAYLRRYEGVQVLCVANLSRFAQPVDLDLAELEGMIPIEMLGYVEFPRIGRQPYRLTLAAYGFLWMEIHAAPDSVDAGARREAEKVALTVGAGWGGLFEGASRHRFESNILPDYLQRQPWLVGKSQRVRETRVMDFVALENPKSALTLVKVQYETGDPDIYVVPLGMAFERAADQLREAAPNGVLAAITGRDGAGVLYDAIFDDNFCVALLELIHNGATSHTRHGVIRGVPGAALASLRGDPQTSLPIRRISGKQNNSSIVYGDRLLLKLFRREQPGPNPDCEIVRYLTEHRDFDRVPPFAGLLEYVPEHTPDSGESATLAMLQGWIANEGDGWTWALEETGRYFENCATIPFPENATPEMAREYLGISLDAAATLGRRTAEMHRALASATDDPAFSPEPLDPQEAQKLVAAWREHAAHVFDALKANVSALPDDVLELAGLVLSRRREVLGRLRVPSGDGPQGLRIRVHGDYHLGQVLRVKTDFVIIDFEGDPALPLAERRVKQSALKDVAGMLRSFSYAAYAALLNYVSRHPEDLAQLEPWARLWEQSTSGEFLRAYHEIAGEAEFLPRDLKDFEMLLNAYRLDRALHELAYEFTNRAAWVRIPLIGILALSS